MLRNVIPIALAAVLTAGCAGNAAKWQQSHVTPEQEAATDPAVLQRMGEKPIVADASLLERVQRVGTRVVQADESLGATWRFTVTDDDRVNGFALPRRLVVIYAGLYRLIESDDQLASVIAYLAARHLVTERRAPADQRAIMEALQWPMPAPAESTARLRKLETFLKLSPAEEAEIDRLTLTYMARAGYDPRAVTAFFAKPEFSGSPDGAARLARLRQLMPDALRIYEAKPGT
jgi:predicted Zn-dependent protease